jgi:hypothetical protein
LRKFRQEALRYIFTKTDLRRRRRMSRVYNFSAGPAVLPEEVLEEAAREMMDYRGTGMSVMEMSQRSMDDLIMTPVSERRSRIIRILSTRRRRICGS